MPRRDGTGPIKSGNRHGRGMGFCNSAKNTNGTRNFGCRRGFCGNSINNTNDCKDEKDLLIEQKSNLEKQLSLINSQLNALQGDN